MDNFLDKRYSEFSESDFISDPLFQDWVIRPNEESDRFWNDFILAYPGKKETLDRARLLINNLQFETDIPDETRIRYLFEEHLKNIEEAKTGRVRSLKPFFRTIMKVAAVMAGIVLLMYVFSTINRKQEDNIVATTYGELRELILPDSTHIILNAHSKIRYSKAWSANEPRELWLEGEAFFDVRHLNKNPAAVSPNERFLVHGDDVTIEVLGTSFNVRQRRGKTEVVLQSGKIKLSVKDEEIIMQRGDWVVYNASDKVITRSVTSPENYAAWKEKKLLLNDPTLEQIIQYLEDTYGKRIVVQDPKLRTKQIEGPILLNNLDDALFVISTVLNVKVEQTDSMVILH